MTADDPDTRGADLGPAGDPGGVAEPGACWNCGAPLPEGAMFCGECGSAVGPRAGRPAETQRAADQAAGRVAQPSADQDESGLPPHGDPLIETPTPEEAAGPFDGAAEGAAAQPSADQNDAGTPPHGDPLLESPADDAAPDSAPTEVQPVVEGDADPSRTGADERADAGTDEDPDGPDPLAPLSPEERFAAERLLDPDSPADKFVLQFSTGESATVYGSGLVGRNPVAEPGEYVDHIVVIRDPGRSVSKTHLEFGQENGALWVLDRFSGNGSVIRDPDASPKRCEPGRRYFVARGARIEIGDQFFVVS